MKVYPKIFLFSLLLFFTPGEQTIHFCRHHVKAFSPILRAKMEAPCTICKQPINPGQYYVQDFWKNKYHSEHKKQYNSCYSCSRLIHPETCGTSVHEVGGKMYFDQRWVCNHCIKDGNLVFFPDEANEILQELLAKARAVGMDIPNMYEVELVFEDQLAKYRGGTLRKGEQNPALTYLELSRKMWSNYTAVDTKCTIYVLTGMHRLFFKECLAHELVHVWIAANCQYELAPAFEEGLCNYFSYQILAQEPASAYKYFYMRTMEKNPDPVYGEGFRKVQQLAERMAGWNGLLTYAQYNQNFPK